MNDGQANLKRIEKWIREGKGTLIDPDNVLAGIIGSEVQLVESFENLITVWYVDDNRSKCAIGKCSEGVIQFRRVAI